MVLSRGDCCLAVALFLSLCLIARFLFFFLNDPATPEISPLPLHAALPISGLANEPADVARFQPIPPGFRGFGLLTPERSEEHTSELQSRLHLVCRLLLEKKKNHQTANADRPTRSHHPEHSTAGARHSTRGP